MGLPDIENIPETGAIFTIGRSRFADNVASHFFIRKDPVVTIACGDEHSAVVCHSGRLFVFGSNDWGQLGLGHKNHVSKPSCVKTLKPEKVTHVACGRAHTLICTGGQKIFACGSDQEGQLGRGNSAIGDSSSSPVLVYDCGLAGPRIVQIAAGSHHSMALTSDGGVVAWGSNLEGQLGLSGISGLVNKPTKVPIPEPVKEITAGYYHSAFLTESGLVYVCGESESGKLGIDVNFSSQVAPKQMQLPCPAKHIACGGHHTLILAENGSVYRTGSNASGQLGMGTNITEIHTPNLLPRDVFQEKSIIKIACGESHSAILTDSGELFTCGDGRHGKLGLEENENNVHELTYAAKYQELFVSSVACGGCHTILVGRRRETDDGGNPETESGKMDQHIQKKNPLPPLKLPVNKLQNEPRVEKMDETDKDQSNDANNSDKTTTDSAEEDTSSKTLADGESNKEAENNVEKPMTSKESSELSTLETAHFADGDEQLDTTNETNDSKEDKDPEMKEEERTMETHVKNNSEETERKMENTRSLDMEERDSNVEIDSNIDKETKADSDKEIPLDPVPPPKPPRQKLGSAEDDSREKVQSPVKMDPEKIEENKNDNRSENSSMKEEEDVTMKSDKIEETKKQKTSPTRVSTSSPKSESVKSHSGTEETIEADTQNAIDKVKEQEEGVNDKKQNVENGPDDSDVVQSPAPRTYKMAKIFKAKKQQEVENGRKISGTPNPKAKSKTCTIL